MEIILIVTILVAMANTESLTLFEVFPASEEQLKQLTVFGNSHYAIFPSPTWYIDSRHPIKVWLPTKFEDIFVEFLICRQMDFIVDENDNMKSALHVFLKANFKKQLHGGEISFDAYHGYNVINSYLQVLALKYPELVTVEKVGRSGEGRDVIAIKISSGGNGTKPLIFIDAGIHAKEWIASVQALYIIQQLIENPSQRYLTQNVDWLILPLANPDGYEFTFNGIKDWRKTRSKGLNCFGTDANRNFDFFWGKVGSSFDECHERYHGPRPFSEPEARAIANLILKYSPQMKLYLSFHSFGQFILYPWAHTYAAPPNVAELDWLGRRVASTIEKFGGSSYSVGSIPTMLYLTSGDSISWAMGVAGIDLAFVMELPPKMYQYPPKFPGPDPEIQPQCIKFVVEETFQGIKVFQAHVENKYATKI